MSCRLSVEHVDGTAALHPGEVFQRSHIEPSLELIDSIAVLTSKIEQKFDLLRGRGRIGCGLLTAGSLVLLRRGLDG